MAHAHVASPQLLSDNSTTATPRKPDLLRGWIKSTRDAMLVFEATRTGIVPRVTRRFHELEKRDIIQSGAILVFTEEESGIKRWTDPYLWSASRMQGNFLMYREREDKHPEAETPYRCSAMVAPSDTADREVDSELEHYILGSWNKGKGLKKNGLMKKTISVSIEDTTYHLVSYYYPSDVRSGILRAPSSMPELANIEISPAMKLGFSRIRHLHGSRGKRERPSRSKKTDSQREMRESLTSSTPASPFAVPSLQESSLYEHCATHAAIPTSPYMPEIPHQHLIWECGVPTEAHMKDMLYEFPVTPQQTDSSYEIWHTWPSAPVPSNPTEEMHTPFHLDPKAMPAVYQDQEASAQDIEFQQELLRSMEETSILMMRLRHEDTLQPDQCHVGPSMYHR